MLRRLTEKAIKTNPSLRAIYLHVLNSNEFVFFFLYLFLFINLVFILNILILNYYFINFNLLILYCKIRNAIKFYEANEYIQFKKLTNYYYFHKKSHDAYLYVQFVFLIF